MERIENKTVFESLNEVTMMRHWLSGLSDTEVATYH